MVLQICTNIYHFLYKLSFWGKFTDLFWFSLSLDKYLHFYHSKIKVYDMSCHEMWNVLNWKKKSWNHFSYNFNKTLKLMKYKCTFYFACIVQSSFSLFIHSGVYSPLPTALASTDSTNIFERINLGYCVSRYWEIYIYCPSSILVKFWYLW